MNIYPLKNKFESFGFKVFEVDGHNIEELVETFEKSKKFKKKPVAIIAKTVKGKGVSFMENSSAWHGKAPSAQDMARIEWGK